MIRTLLTTLAILGMILQPIANARSADLQERGVDQHLASMDQGKMVDHAMMAQIAEDDMPCHTTAPASKSDCEECCDAECTMMEQCRTSGLQAPVVVLKLTHTFYSHSDKTFLSLASIRFTKGIPGFIDHPPKHA